MRVDAAVSLSGGASGEPGIESFDLPPDADAELPERLRHLLEEFGVVAGR
ncbi:hypothetical protein ABT030_30925 [Streptomyces mirabilis]